MECIRRAEKIRTALNKQAEEEDIDYTPDENFVYEELYHSMKIKEFLFNIKEKIITIVNKQVDKKQGDKKHGDKKQMIYDKNIQIE